MDVACREPVGLIPRSAHINLILYCRGGGLEGEMSARIALNGGLADDGKRIGLSESTMDVAFGGPEA